jgi:AcrR family transcriptional regulator
LLRCDSYPRFVSRTARRTDANAALFDVAGKLLASEGPHALSVRRIAEVAGTSTQAVYTQFGGKAGLADALYQEGYRRLAQLLAQMEPADDPVQAVRDLGEVYRASAFANPHLYDVMTARPIPEYEPTEEARRVAFDTFRPLLRALTFAVDKQILSGDPHAIAQQLWAAGHGLVSLTIHGHITEVDCRMLYASTVESILEHYRS